jgi:DNA polymerase-3 subunit alpha
MAALLTSICDDREKVMKYIGNSKRMGMTVLPPDVNLSSYGFVNEGENGLRYGMGSISGVGYTNVENIIASRPYTSIKDMIERAEKKAINKKVLTALTLSGALDSLVNNDSTDFIKEYIDITSNDKPVIRHRLDLLQYIYSIRGDKDKLDVDNFTSNDELQQEVEYLGLYLSRHPLDGIAEPIDWDGLWNDSVFDCTAIIRDYRVIKTKKGDDMAFIDIESLEGHKNLVLFPKIYSKVKSKLKKDNTVTFTIRKKYNGDKDSFIVENIKSMKKTSKGES